MMEFEFGSTAADEMSVFHSLLPLKGTKPFNATPCPALIALQESFWLPVPVPGPEPVGPFAGPALLPPPQAVKAVMARKSMLECRHSEVFRRFGISAPLSVLRLLYKRSLWSSAEVGNGTCPPDFILRRIYVPERSTRADFSTISTTACKTFSSDYASKLLCFVIKRYASSSGSRQHCAGDVSTFSASSA